MSIDEQFLRSGLHASGLLLATVLLNGCGGGGGASNDSSSSASSSSTISTAQRATASTQTAQTNASCTAIQPFYWEIGDKSGALVSGSTGNGTYAANTTMLIASASKWLFGAYVAELRHGQMTDADIQALTMRSGYTSFNYTSCKTLAVLNGSTTVDDCFKASNLSGGNNNDYDAAAVGKFFYNGGHFQKYADVDLALANTTSSSLQTAIQSQLGADVMITYDSPQLAAGVSTTPANYAYFLRKILNDQLYMHDLLGSNAVCTNPSTCSSSLYTPVPSTESWHYSLAHWVEDDPTVGDGTFSSAGAFGFYPWIDSSKTYYGVLARQDSVFSDPASASVACGRLIRKAWMTGVAQ